jgi:serine/threonine-protein kinase RsbW
VDRRVHHDERQSMDLPTPEKPDVVLRVPADSAYVSVLRTMTAGLAARLDFTVDDIEDLRIAVGEACALVLPEATSGGDLLAEFRLHPGTLSVSVSVPNRGSAAPDQESFAWQVLSTLATSTEVTARDDRYEVTFVTESSLPPVEGRSGALG